MPHTPEPWYLHKGSDAKFVRSKSFRTRYYISGSADPNFPPFIAVILMGFPEEQQAATGELMLRAPRLARALNTLLTEVSDGFSSEGTSPMALAMQDAEALVRELREAGVL